MVARALLDPAQPGLRRQVDVIQRSAERMSRLIEDLLQAATIEAGRFSVELGREEVSSIVDETLQGLEAAATVRSVRLQRDVAEDLPMIRCDKVRIIQVLSNLIANAIEVVADDGTVRLRVSPDAGGVHFAISDRGPGIAEADLPHLFERYWKGKAKGRHGFGLGLYISKGIIEAHGGRMWVESRIGQGSTFFFSVPAAHDLGEHVAAT
ncbi:MAG TPA: HAMP domain-containing sensor histidine kinase [Polyangia bacterium]|jgi:signal transduction histidine kinase